MSEADLLKSTLQLLQMRGVFAWRNNSSLTILGEGKSRRVIRGAPAGSPDILGALPGGSARLFGIELKAPNGVIRASQKRWAERAAKHGVLYGIARHPREAMGLIEKWSGGSR